jgi:hypothetical protein
MNREADVVSFFFALIPRRVGRRKFLFPPRGGSAIFSAPFRLTSREVNFGQEPLNRARVVLIHVTSATPLKAQVVPTR